MAEIKKCQAGLEIMLYLHKSLRDVVRKRCDIWPNLESHFLGAPHGGSSTATDTVQPLTRPDSLLLHTYQSPPPPPLIQIMATRVIHQPSGNLDE